MKQIQLKYLFRAIKEQGPWKRAFKNFVINRNAWGMFSKYAHYTKELKEKVGYSDIDSANKAAEKMQKKTGFYYSKYFCPRCGRYHLGRNRTSFLQSL